MVKCDFGGGQYHYGSLHTVWSVNDGLSGNLWKPPETGRGGFRQVCEFFISIFFFSIFFINRKIRKPAGNLRGRFPEVSG
jgi:hypothetical protein